MWAPVTLPPLTALALARDSARGRPGEHTAVLLTLTVLLGFVGSGFHAFGVSRNMGGWANWRQTLARRAAGARPARPSPAWPWSDSPRCALMRRHNGG